MCSIRILRIQREFCLWKKVRFVPYLERASYLYPNHPSATSTVTSCPSMFHCVSGFIYSLSLQRSSLSITPFLHFSTETASIPVQCSPHIPYIQLLFWQASSASWGSFLQPWCCKPLDQSLDQSNHPDSPRLTLVDELFFRKITHPGGLTPPQYVASARIILSP